MAYSIGQQITTTTSPVVGSDWHNKIKRIEIAIDNLEMAIKREKEAITIQSEGI